MSALVWITWIATAVILGTYAGMQRGYSSRAFDWANAIGCVPLVAMDLIVGAVPAAVISVCFGAIAWYGILAAWREKRRLTGWVTVKAVGSTMYHPSGLRLEPDEAWRKSVQLHVDAIEELRSAR